MTRSPKFLYVGTYERDYPRNQQLIRLLRSGGADLTEIHEPFWEHFRDKSTGFGGFAATIMLAIQLAVIYLKLALRVGVRLRSADAVVIGYIGQLDMLILGGLARLSGTPVLFNPLVTLTDAIVEDRALVRERSFAGRLVWLVDWISLRMASMTLADTEENAVYMAERFGVSRSRIRVLYVGADERVFHHRPSPGSRDGLLHILFYGKMIPLHGVDTILSALKILHENGDTGISFEIIGSGQQVNLIERFTQSSPDAPLVHRPWVAYSRLPGRIGSADCVLGIFGAGEKANRVIPNKVFQAMAIGVPIVTRDSHAVRNVLVHEESALMVNPGDPSSLADSLLRLSDPEFRSRLSAGARTAFEKYGSDRALAPVVDEIMCSLVSCDEDRDDSRRRV
ncbi:MAG: glycosyltransferase [Thermomicrobiaceae bacterium]